MLGKIVAIMLSIAIILLAILTQLTKPATIGPLGIFFVFTLMYVSVLGILTFLLFGVSRLFRKMITTLNIKKSVGVLSLRRSYYFSSVLALAPVIFIGLQSVGEIGVYELFLIALFVSIACVYIAKKT